VTFVPIAANILLVQSIPATFDDLKVLNILSDLNPGTETDLCSLWLICLLPFLRPLSSLRLNASYCEPDGRQS
jgi:hypothetical protein